MRSVEEEGAPGHELSALRRHGVENAGRQGLQVVQEKLMRLPRRWSSQGLPRGEYRGDSGGMNKNLLDQGR